MPPTVVWLRMGTMSSPWPPSTIACTLVTETRSSAASTASRAWRARHAGAHGGHIGAADVRVVVGAGQAHVEALDGAAFQQVERLPLRQALDHVEEDDVAEALERCEVRQRAADHSRADERDLLAGHAFPHSVCPGLRASTWSASRRKSRSGSYGRCAISTKPADVNRAASVSTS